VVDRAKVLPFPDKGVVPITQEQERALIHCTGMDIDQWNDLSISGEYPDAVRYVPIWDED